jgi:hypothetical protein
VKKKKIVLKWHKQILHCTKLAINASVTEESLEKKHMKIIVVNEVRAIFGNKRCKKMEVPWHGSSSFYCYGCKCFTSSRVISYHGHGTEKQA